MDNEELKGRLEGSVAAPEKCVQVSRAPSPFVSSEVEKRVQAPRQSYSTSLEANWEAGARFDGADH